MTHQPHLHQPDELLRVAGSPPPLELVVGHVYQAKRPAVAGTLFDRLYNDRQILHVGMFEVQYDSPTVGFGRHYPRVTIEQFRKWAAADVTEKMPEKSNWRRWDR